MTTRKVQRLKLEDLDEHIHELEVMKRNPYRTPQDLRRAEQILIDTLYLLCMALSEEAVGIKSMKILELYNKIRA